jgi:hypothetical protein
LPPLQNNTVLGVVFSGTQPIPGTVTVTPNLATIGGVPNWLVSYSVQATFQGAAQASTTTMQFTFTKTNYVYAGPQPTALITIQAGATPVPFNVSFTEKNGGIQLTPNVPPPHAGDTFIGAFTTLTATWVSFNNNFKNTTFYIQSVFGSKITLGTVLAASAVITSIGGGKYQAVFNLTVNTSAYKQWHIAPFPGYGGQYDAFGFSYLGTCTDNTSVAFTDTNGYFSTNP